MEFCSIIKYKNSNIELIKIIEETTRHFSFAESIVAEIYLLLWNDLIALYLFFEK